MIHIVFLVVFTFLSDFFVVVTGEHNYSGGEPSPSYRKTTSANSSGIDISTPVNREKKFVTFSCECGKCSIFGYISGEHKCSGTSKPPKIIVRTLVSPEERPVTSKEIPYCTFEKALQKETEKVHEKFCSLLRRTFSKLKTEAKYDLDDVKGYIQSLLSPPGNVIYNHTDERLLESILCKIASFNELRQFVQNKLCSWYNHAIIAALRREFLFPETDEGISEYKKLFKQYVGRFCFLYLEDLGPQPQEVEIVLVTCKIDVDFKDMTQAKIDMLKYEFTECVTEICDHHLMLKNVQDGCTELVFRAPIWAMNISTLTESQVCCLRKNGFIEISINDRKLLSKVIFKIFMHFYIITSILVSL